MGQYSEQRKKRATKLMESKLREEYLSEDSACSGEDEVYLVDLIPGMFVTSSCDVCAIPRYYLKMI